MRGRPFTVTSLKIVLPLAIPWFVNAALHLRSLPELLEAVGIHQVTYHVAPLPLDDPSLTLCHPPPSWLYSSVYPHDDGIFLVHVALPRRRAGVVTASVPPWQVGRGSLQHPAVAGKLLSIADTQQRGAFLKDLDKYPYLRVIASNVLL